MGAITKVINALEDSGFKPDEVVQIITLIACGHTLDAALQKVIAK